MLRFFGVNQHTFQWNQKVVQLLTAERMGKPIPITIVIGAAGQPEDFNGKGVISEDFAESHPEWIRIKAGDCFIGSVRSKFGKVNLPDLPFEYRDAEDILPALQHYGGEMEVFLVGRIVLNHQSGYQALILADEDTDEWLELGASNSNSSSKKEDNGKEVKGNMTLKNTEIRKNAKSGAEHTMKAVVSGVRLTRDLVKWTIPFVGKVLRGAGRVSQLSGETMSHIGKKLDR